MERSDTHRVAVIGGGITGLAAAHDLHRHLPPASVVLLEDGNRLGGAVRTERVDGCTFEAGPDTLLTTKPGGIELCRQVGLGERLVRIGAGGRGTEILHGDRLHRLPDGFLLMAPTRLWPVLGSSLFSWRAKVRMAWERFVPARLDDGADESLSSFVTRRFGREALERAAEPVIGALFTGDAERMSLNAFMPRFREMERRHGSIRQALVAMRRKRPPGADGDPGPFAYLRDGLGSLVERLVDRLPPGSVRTGARVERIAFNPISGRWRLTIAGKPRVEAEAVIFAAPAHALGRLVTERDPALHGMLARIDYAPCATISLVYRRADLGRPLRSFGFFVPRNEPSPLLACSFVSEKFEGRVPHDRVLLRAFVGGALSPGVLEREDGELIDEAHRELVRVLGLRARPLHVRVYRFPRGMPQYAVGFPGRRAEIERRFADHPGWFVAGSSVGAVGLPDCIRSGQRAARQAADWLARRAEGPEAAADAGAARP